MLEEMTHCIPPNPRMVGNIVAIHVPLDGPLYTWAQYTPTQSTGEQPWVRACVRVCDERVGLSANDEAVRLKAEGKLTEQNKIGAATKSRKWNQLHS